MALALADRLTLPLTDDARLTGQVRSSYEHAAPFTLLLRQQRNRRNGRDELRASPLLSPRAPSHIILVAVAADISARPERV